MCPFRIRVVGEARTAGSGYDSRPPHGYWYKCKSHQLLYCELNVCRRYENGARRMENHVRAVPGVFEHPEPRITAHGSERVSHWPGELARERRCPGHFCFYA